MASVAQNASKTRPAISLRRKILFALVASIVGAAILLVAAEGVLRLFNVGYSPAFLVPGADGDYFHNPDFGRRFFPSSLSRGSQVMRLAKTKPEGTRRVFVLGGSAVNGFPNSSFSFSRVLETMLHDHESPRKFEVINTGITAINSHVVREIARDCARHEPDLFVVYLGNNEVVGPYGPGTMFQTFTPSLGVIRASIFVKGTRLGQLVSQFGESGHDSEWTGMNMFVEHKVRQDDPRLPTVYEHLRKNLEAICDIAIAADAHVVLCTVTSNLKDCAPFASEPRLLPSEVTTRYEQAVGLEADRRFEEALAHYRFCLEHDSGWADCHYRAGRCQLELGRAADAKTSFSKARDADALRFRADSKINETIRDVAESYKVPLVDAEELFSSDGITGYELLLEHVHFNFSGACHLASSLLETVAELFPGEVPAQRLTEPECASRLAYTAWNRHLIETQVAMMMNEPPFTNQLGHETDLEDRFSGWQASENQLDDLMRTAEDVYSQAIRRAPTDTMLRVNYANLLNGLGRFTESAAQVDVARERFPAEPTYVEWQRLMAEKLFAKATSLADAGEYSAAAADFREAQRIAANVRWADMVNRTADLLDEYQRTGAFEGLVDRNRGVPIP